MQINPYTSTAEDTNNQYLRVGFVTSYNPDKRVYTVDVDNKGQVVCKQAESGALRPYNPGTRVVASYFAGSEWTILAELPQAASSPEFVADSEEETLARGRGRLQNSVETPDDFVPSYRTVDSAGESEVPVFVGDVRIENRSDRNILRSFLQIFSFGDILLKSSSFCYIHLSKLRSTIIFKARDLRQRFAGYSQDIVTPAKGDQANKTTVTEEYRADPLQNAADLTFRYANLAAPGSKLVLGYEVNHKDGFEHLDLTNNTKRVACGTSSMQIGDTTTAAPAGVFDFNTSYPGRGFLVQTGKNHVMLSEDQNNIILKINDKEHTIKITEYQIEIERGAQKITLKDDGVDIKATNLTVDVSGDTRFNSGKTMSFNAPLIDFN